MVVGPSERHWGPGRGGPAGGTVTNSWAILSSTPVSDDSADLARDFLRPATCRVGEEVNCSARA